MASRRARGTASEKMLGVMCGVEAVGFQAIDWAAPGTESPSRVLEDLIRLINPTGHLGIVGPVLEDGDFVLWDSTAILRYLAAGTALVPTARRVAAEVDRWLAWQLAHLGLVMSKVAFERVVKPLRRLSTSGSARMPTFVAAIARSAELRLVAGSSAGSGRPHATEGLVERRERPDQLPRRPERGSSLRRIA